MTIEGKYTKNFCKSVQIHCKEKVEKNTGYCKAFSITRKRNKLRPHSPRRMGKPGSKQIYRTSFKAFFWRYALLVPETIGL